MNKKCTICGKDYEGVEDLGFATAPAICDDCYEAATTERHAAERKAAATTLGSIKSDKKTASSRENGKLGGRPRKLNKQIDFKSYDAAEQYAIDNKIKKYRIVEQSEDVYFLEYAG